MDGHKSIEVQASDVVVDLRGCLSRTEWELVYLMASKFAQEHGLTITAFDLLPAELNDPQAGRDAISAAGARSTEQVSGAD